MDGGQEGGAFCCLVCFAALFLAMVYCHTGILDTVSTFISRAILGGIDGWRVRVGAGWGYVCACELDSCWSGMDRISKHSVDM